MFLEQTIDALLRLPGENIIMIVGGANQSEWKFSDDDHKVSLLHILFQASTLC